MTKKQDKKIEKNIEKEKIDCEKNNFINKDLITFLENQLQESEKKILEKKISIDKELTIFLNRSNKTINQARKFSLEKCIINFLPIFDNVERSLNLIKKNMSNKFFVEIKNKLELISDLLNQAFQQFHIKKIDAINVPFDPSIHEAMSIHYTNNMDSNKIVTVMQPGYILHNSRLLRPAMVLVSKKKI
ncbi:molecular chaperone GrpE [Buchnera aphidicola (Diuraphis noxia)]|uniref:Protein GrpE n=1 Tax=Buchnera aphidicola subsp. Diuraphis noxia TaxID=118101 RepID=A0A1B2H8W2_BUCDN|nr:nucleotide exchange factor GrpE [Buchnera aphidicola]ANZ22469.1 molecular chaperone GrpE [Buchnera aphidicola (Diuraphis noxia)]